MAGPEGALVQEPVATEVTTGQQQLQQSLLVSSGAARPIWTALWQHVTCCAEAIEAVLAAEDKAEVAAAGHSPPLPGLPAKAWARACSQELAAQQKPSAQQWDELPSLALLHVAHALDRQSIAMARGTCSSWRAEFAEGIKHLAPGRFSCRSARAVGRADLLASLAREAMKPPADQRDLAISQLLRGAAAQPALCMVLHAQVAEHLRRWQLHLGRLVQACPMATFLDLSACAAVLSDADLDAMSAPPRAASSSSSTAGSSGSAAATAAAQQRAPWQHPCTHVVVAQDALPLPVAALLRLLRDLPQLAGVRLRVVKVNRISIPDIVFTLRSARVRVDIDISFLQSAKPSGLAQASPQSGWNVLPLDDEDLLQLALLPEVTSVDLTEQPEIGDVGAAALAMLPQLRSASLSGTRVTNLGVSMLAESKTLTRLDLSRCKNVDDTGFASLTGLTGLRVLDLSECASLTDVSLAALAEGLRLLEELNLHGCVHVSDAGLAALQHHSALTSLNVALCREITDVGVAALCKLPQLRVLDLTFCDQVTDEGLRQLTSLTALELLTLACCKFSTLGIHDLARLSLLTHLDLVGCVDGMDTKGIRTLTRVSGLASLNLAFCEVGDEGVQALSELTTLTELDLTYCKYVTDSGIRGLSTLTRMKTLKLQGIASGKAPQVGTGLGVGLLPMRQLQALTLQSAALAPEAMTVLPELTSLTSLNLTYCRIVRDADVAGLARLSQLQALKLSGNQLLTDAAVPHLLALKALRRLDLGGTQLTDAGLLQLSSLLFLTSLQVNACPQLTEQGLDALITALPGLRSLDSAHGAAAVPSSCGEAWPLWPRP